MTRTYVDEAGVGNLLSELEHHLPVYLQLIDPSADVEASDERIRAFILLSTLSATRFRPIVLAAVDATDPSNLRRLLDILIPGMLAGGFGTGSIEAQFARTARRLHLKEPGVNWETSLATLAELLPSREEFEIRMKRGFPKHQALVLRSALTQSTTLPHLDGFPHQVRPRNGEAWNEFGPDDYRRLGATLANWVLIRTERRPQGSRTPESVKEKFIQELIAGERLTAGDIDLWTASFIETKNAELASRIGDLWYD